MKEPKTSSVITRYEKNPVLTPRDVPYESSLTYNAGVTKYQGKYVMVFRNDFGVTQPEFESGTKNYQAMDICLGIAYSDDGKKWHVEPKPCFKIGSRDSEIIYAYDPRLTVLEGRVYLCFVLNTKHGLRGGIAVTDDFQRFDILDLTVPDNRNLALFPERLGGRYVRLERPFPVYSRDGKDRFDIWLSASPDLKYWGDSHLVLGVEDVPYSNDKIGPAAPPLRTDKGWLTVFHAVDRDDAGRGKNGWEKKWAKRYTAGIMLLDLEDPSKVVGMSKEPLIAPEAPYEKEGGFRNDVIFPGGAILEDDGEVKIYYGAGDAFECLCSAHVDDLIKLCTEPR